MSARITCEQTSLVPSEGRPLDDVEYPGFLHPTRLGSDHVRIEVVGTSHRLDNKPVAPDFEISGDRPYLEITLTGTAARGLAESLIDEVDRAARSTSSRRQGDDRPG